MHTVKSKSIFKPLFCRIFLSLLDEIMEPGTVWCVMCDVWCAEGYTRYCTRILLLPVAIVESSVVTSKFKTTSPTCNTFLPTKDACALDAVAVAVPASVDPLRRHYTCFFRFNIIRSTKRCEWSILGGRDPSAGSVHYRQPWICRQRQTTTSDPAVEAAWGSKACYPTNEFSKEGASPVENKCLEDTFDIQESQIYSWQIVDCGIRCSRILQGTSGRRKQLSHINSYSYFWKWHSGWSNLSRLCGEMEHDSRWCVVELFVLAILGRSPSTTLCRSSSHVARNYRPRTVREWMRARRSPPLFLYFFSRHHI